MSRVVRAAGGVLWRSGDAGIEVAVVHRPRYDDWSLPKGKLDDGELPVLGALREVREETGHTAVVGRSLGSSTYRVLVDDVERDKTVRWWAMCDGGGTFVPGPEVDELVWLSPDDAARRLTVGRDVAPLRLLVEQGTGTSTVLLVRHARAGTRSAWDGPDDLRPLDARGEVQARAVADVLPAWGVARVVSAPALRCTATVTPLAEALGLPVEVDERFAEAAYAADPDAALRRVHELAERPGATVVCSQRGPVPGLVGQLAEQAGLDLPEPAARKGSVWALSLRDGRLVDADHLPSVVGPHAG